MTNIDKIGSVASPFEKKEAKTLQNQKGELNFGDVLDSSLKELNEIQINADKAIADLATGEVKDLHQAAIAIGKETHARDPQQGPKRIQRNLKNANLNLESAKIKNNRFICVYSVFYLHIFGSYLLPRKYRKTTAKTRN